MSAPYLLVAGDFVETGGMDRANLALARFLAQTAEVHLVCHRSDNGLLANRRAIHHLVKKPLGSYLLGEPLLNLEGRRWAKRLSGRQTRVLTNGGNCFAPGVNWVHYVHSVPYNRNRGASLRSMVAKCATAKYIHDEKRAFRRADLVIANSRRTAQDLTEFAGVPESKIRVVYYGIDRDKFKPRTADERLQTRSAVKLPTDRPLVIFVGALGDLRKGFDRLFEAWLLLCQKPSWDANLVVVGAGASLDLWRSKATEKGIANRIHFLGFRPDVPNIVGCCDAMIAPTRYEAYGLAVHEAICSGIPAFVSAKAGVAERYPADLQDFLISESDTSEDISDRLWRWRRETTGSLASWSVFAEQLRSRSWNDMSGEVKELLDSLNQ